MTLIDEEREGAMTALELEQVRELGRQALIAERERCIMIAEGVVSAAEAAAAHMSYSELYGEQCKIEAAQEIIRLIRAGAL